MSRVYPPGGAWSIPHRIDSSLLGRMCGHAVHSCGLPTTTHLSPGPAQPSRALFEWKLTACLGSPAAAFTASIDFEDFERAKAKLTAANAFEEPSDRVRLLIPD
jgi:hypothetical protein